MNKTDLRKKLIAARLNISEADARAAAISLSKNLSPLIPAGAKVASYLAMRGEIDPAEFVKELWKKGNIVALPAICDDSKILKFLEFNSKSALVTGKHGTRQTSPDSAEIIPDIVIVPTVGFDKNRNRLGYGGGYYDTTINYLRKINKNVQIIAVGYNIQELENIPTEPHDERPDLVVTETRIIK